MCGIVGYIGHRPALPIILQCLERLEYRGYDSCGLAIAEVGCLRVYKDRVRVAELSEMVPPLSGTFGIGHTRWATCGKPSMKNAHPQCDCCAQIAVVHNGIISNYQELRQKLLSEGHHFVSETDTEVLPHLIEKYYTSNLENAVAAALREVSGSYAVAVLKAGEGKLVVARKDSPLVIGIGDGENFVASDVPALLGYTSRVVYLEEDDIGVVMPSCLCIKRNGTVVQPREVNIAWHEREARRDDYAHFMLKEIHEEPRVVRDLLCPCDEAKPVPELVKACDSNTESMLIFGCGSSYHAALIGKHIFEKLLRIPVRAELASEFSYDPQTQKPTAALALTQSGETADTLRVVRQMERAGCRVTAVTNVRDSSISRLAYKTIYTEAGPEKSVASTKTFTAQLALLYRLGLANSRIGAHELAGVSESLKRVCSRIEQLLDD